MNTRMSDLDRASCALKAGKLVAIPTETVYGLSAPMNDQSLVQKIYQAKNRPVSNPLIVHVNGWPMAESLLSEKGRDQAKQLTDMFWPGPLTLLLAKSSGVPSYVTAGSSEVAIRMPNHPLTLAWISHLGEPIVAPSANPYGKLSPTTASAVRAYFSADEVEVLDGSPCSVGIESCILRIHEGQASIVRPGTLNAEDLRCACLDIGLHWSETQTPEVSAPGQAKAHYRPSIPLFIAFSEVSDIEKQKIVDKACGKPSVWQVWRLGPDPQDVAKRLYPTLARMSENQIDAIWLEAAPELREDVAWAGIWDRLQRAASLIVD